MSVVKWVGVAFAAACIGLAAWTIRGHFAEQGASKQRPAWEVPAAAPRRPPAAMFAGRPVTRPSTFVLSGLAGPQTPPTMTDDDWRRAFPAFAHPPYDEAGFLPIALPWRFAATPDATDADPGVARAVSLLLGYDLGWSPAARPAPPPFLVFRRSGDLPAAAAAEAYDPAAVAALVKRWGGTHAVGGVLVRGKDGYVATLQIFDRAGKPVHEAAFERPQDIFPLLGDVSCDALRFFGTPANDALSARLHAKRCERPDSLAKLGRASLGAGRPQDVQAACDQVVDADPTFAEARMWRATHRAMADGDVEAFAADMAEVVDATGHVVALAELPVDAAAADAVRQLPRWVDAAEALAGKDHPAVVLRRLKLATLPNNRRGPFDAAEFKRMVAVAARHPNDWPLLQAVVEGYGLKEDLRRMVLASFDPDVVGSVSVTGLLAPGAGRDRAHAWLWVARAAKELDRPAQVLAALDRFEAATGTPVRSGRFDSRGQWRAEALMLCGRFAEAAAAYAVAARDDGNEWTVRFAATCAAIGGRSDVLDALEADPRTNIPNVTRFIKACAAYLAGKPVTPADFYPRADDAGSFNGPQEWLLAEAELAAGGLSASPPPAVWKRWVEHDWHGSLDPLAWVLIERYYRMLPGLPHAASFYEAAEWERPDAPGVAEAVARWRQGGGRGDPSLPTVDELIAMAGNPRPSIIERVPTWVVVARLRREVEENRPADALRLADALSRNGQLRIGSALQKVRALAAGATTTPAVK